MRKNNGKVSGMPAGIVAGLLVSMMTTVVGSIITALLIAGEKMGEGQVIYGAVATLIVGSFLGALVASSAVDFNRFVVSSIVGVAYIVVLFCITVLFFGGLYENVWTTGLLIMGGSVAASLVGLRRKSTSFKNKRYRVRIP